MDLKAIFKQMKDGRINWKSFNRLTVAIIIASTLIGSSILVYAKIPPLIYGVPLFGFAGFGVAFFMGLVLAYSIYKGGKLWPLEA